jgi:glycerol-3-phosphate acyltransferase PlsX
MKKRKKVFRIGVDIMGADTQPETIVHAIYTLPPDTFTNSSFVIYATEEMVQLFKNQYKKDPYAQSISFCPCKEVVAMDDTPLFAIKKKKESTLAIGINDHKEGKTDAFVSCANTGALVTQAILALPCIEQITRPALVTVIPSLPTSMVVLDVGATVEATCEQLVQLAFLGASFARCVLKREKPRVALLNIGAEFGKGTKEISDAYKVLQNSPDAYFTFVGNKEPQALFTDRVDVVVTSGFAGNIFLKTAEATALLLLEVIQKNFQAGSSPDSYFPYSQIKRSFSQDEAAGALLYGLDGYIFKCHGAATALSIQKALLGARSLLELELLDFTKSALKQSFLTSKKKL